MHIKIKQLLLIALTPCLLTVCSVGSKKPKQEVVYVEKNDLDLIENFKVGHILKIAELKLSLPKKGDSIDSIFNKLNKLKSIKVTKQKNLVLIQESKPTVKPLFEMKLFFIKGKFSNGIVNNLDGTW